MDSNIVIEKIKKGKYDDSLIDIYVDENRLEYQKDRYIDVITRFVQNYGEGEIEIYSAPGRSEIGGNHTDHQHGEVLAAAINLDAIAVVRKRDDNTVSIISDGYDKIVLSLDDKQLEMTEEEKGTTKSLIKGIIAKMKENRHKTGGFNAYIKSDVLVSAINDGDIDRFLKLVKRSGDSSYKYLQNVYTNKDIMRQNVSVALAVSDMVLGDNGVSRVHGGGFAGTIQAFVKKSHVDSYKKQMDNVFGEGACVVLEIRKYGGLKVL